MAKITYSKLLAGEREHARNVRARVANLQEHQSAITAALAVTADVLAGADRTWADLSYAYFAITAEFDVDSLKTGKIPEILALCESLPGFTAASSTDHVSEYSAERTFRYAAQFGDLSVRLRITANLPTEGAACRRVQVGVETKTVPVYKIECAE